MLSLKCLSPQVSTKGLVAWWKLYDGSAFDYSLNGNLATLNGSSIVYAYPGVDFAGSDEYIDPGSTFQSTFRGSFSISCWFKADDGQPLAATYLWGVDEGNLEDITYFSLGTTGAFLFKYTSDGNAANLGSGVVMSNGQEDWHHITAVADSTINGAGGLKMYLDGDYVTPVGFTGNTSGVVFADFTITYNLFIGAENVIGSSNGEWAGLIDDFMIFNVAKSAEDAKSIYEMTRGRYGV